MLRIENLRVAVPGDHGRPLKNFRKYFGAVHKVMDISKWRFIGTNTANRMFLKKEADWIQNNIHLNSMIFVVVEEVTPESERGGNTTFRREEILMKTERRTI